jgi:hypothetical protein
VRVYVLTLETGDDDEGRTVEGVYATAQAAADAVADGWGEEDDNDDIRPARDLDEWEEESPEAILFQGRLTGPGTTWRIERHQVQQELPDRDLKNTELDLDAPRYDHVGALLESLDLSGEEPDHKCIHCNAPVRPQDDGFCDPCYAEYAREEGIEDG